MVTCNYLLGRKYCSPVPNCKDFTFVRIKNALVLNLDNFFSLCSSCSKTGGQLIQFERASEASLMIDFLLYSQSSLPLKSGWLTGAFIDPHFLVTTLTSSEVHLLSV